MDGLVEDRRIRLMPFIAYHDGTQLRVISYAQDAYFLTQPRGFHAIAPI